MVQGGQIQYIKLKQSNHKPGIDFTVPFQKHKTLSLNVSNPSTKMAFLKRKDSLSSRSRICPANRLKCVGISVEGSHP